MEMEISTGSSRLPYWIQHAVEQAREGKVGSSQRVHSGSRHRKVRGPAGGSFRQKNSLESLDSFFIKLFKEEMGTGLEAGGQRLGHF